MARSTWDELPPAVRAAIEQEVGPVAAAEIPAAGRNSDFSATLHTADGRVFCKGIADAEGKRGQMHRHEAYINPCCPRQLPPVSAGAPKPTDGSCSASTTSPAVTPTSHQARQTCL